MMDWLKRYLLLAGIAGLIGMTLCGCSKKQAEETVPQPELIIGSDDYEPYNYQDENGDYAGIDVELAKEACSRIGYTPVFKQIAWDDKDHCLESGEIDCAWGSFSMNDREDDYIWVGPYMYSREVVMVRSDSDIYTLSDLSGKNVAVQSSTQPERLFLQHEDTRIPSVKNVYCFVQMNELFAALRKGYVDACAGHEVVLREYLRQSGQQYRILDEEIIVSRLGVGFSKNKDSQKAERLSEAIQEMIEDGTLQRILEKYGLGEQAVTGGIAP